MEISQDTLTIGFSGHLSLDDTPEDTLRSALDATFTLVRDAARAALQSASTVGAGPKDQKAILRLLTGYGPGADRLAVNTWRQLGDGPVHAVFPYLDPDDQYVAWTDDPAIASLEARVAGIGTSFDAFTVLDGAKGQTDVAPRHAHLEVAHVLTEWSQVLVAFWNGKPGGDGGTADSVFLALKNGVPVLWIRADASVQLNLVDPSKLGNCSSARELAEKLGDTNGSGLTHPPEVKILSELFDPLFARPRAGAHHDAHPASDPVEAFNRHVQSIAFDADGAVIPEAWWTRIRFGIYGAFVSALSYGAVCKTKSMRSPPIESGRFFWFWRSKPAVDITDRMDPIRLLFLQADTVADRLSDRHRSTQIVISVLAILAVAVAMVPAIASDWKVHCVAFELLILVLGGLTYRWGKKAGNDLVWSDARRLGERLRAVRVLWPLGRDQSGIRPGPPASWSEWRVKKLLRQVGPPTGRLDHCEMLKRADVARVSLAKGQMAYHWRTKRRHGRIHKNIERIENSLFYGLLVLLVVYLAAYGCYILNLLDVPPPLFGKAVLFASAVVPAVGAAFIATESRFEFGHSAHRSAEMARRFKSLNQELKAEIEKGDDASLTYIYQKLGEVADLALADVDSWRDDLDRRGLIMQG